MKCDFVSEFLEIRKIIVVGVSRDHIAVDAVHRNGVGDGVQVVVAVQHESEIILIALLHELVQLPLALLSVDIAAEHYGQQHDKIT